MSPSRTRLLWIDGALLGVSILAGVASIVTPGQLGMILFGFSAVSFFPGAILLARRFAPPQEPYPHTPVRVRPIADAAMGMTMLLPAMVVFWRGEYVSPLLHLTLRFLAMALLAGTLFDLIRAISVELRKRRGRRVSVG